MRRFLAFSSLLIAAGVPTFLAMAGIEPSESKRNVCRFLAQAGLQVSDNCIPFDMIWIYAACIILAALASWILLKNSNQAARTASGDNSVNIAGNVTGGTVAHTINTSIVGDNRPIARIGRLFSGIDRRINYKIGRIEVRMEPTDIDQLRTLISDAGENAPVQILSVGPAMFHCHISNGTLGVQHACEVQHKVQLNIVASLS